MVDTTECLNVLLVLRKTWKEITIGLMPYSIKPLELHIYKLFHALSISNWKDPPKKSFWACDQNMPRTKVEVSFPRDPRGTQELKGRVYLYRQHCGCGGPHTQMCTYIIIYLLTVIIHILFQIPFLVYGQFIPFSIVLSLNLGRMV